MSQENNTVTVSIPVEEIERRLYKLFTDTPHRKLITTKIIDNLKTTERGFEHLVLALSGMEVTCSKKIGEVGYVDYSSISKWNFNEKNTREAGKIFKLRGSKTDYILCEIVEIDLRKRHFIKVQYTGLNDTHKETTQDYWISEPSFKKKDPVFFCSLSPPEEKKDDDLPF